MTSTQQAIDPGWFRQVLGRYPTGVTVITAIGAEGKPVGLAVGTFTSVSLDPPLVGFLPDRSSSSWPKIREAGVFCVNVLAHEQEPICRAFATKKPDKFEGLSWRPAGSGSPILDGVVAWIDCDLEAVHDAGDHEIVIGRVRELHAAEHNLPLVFFEGGYGRFDPLSRAAADADLSNVLRYIDPARPEMERVADELGVEIVTTGRVADEVVAVAAAGSVQGGHGPARVGHRAPYAPPLGIAIAAYEGDEGIEAWLRRAAPKLDEEEQASWRRAMERLRERGYRVRLSETTQAEHDARIVQLNEIPDAARRGRVFSEFFEGRLSDEYGQRPLDPEETYDIGNIGVTVTDREGGPLFSLTAFGIPEPCSGAEAERIGRRLELAAATIREQLISRGLI